MQPIKRTMVLEPGEVNDNKIPVEPLHCPFVEHLVPMRGVSADGQICAAEGAEDAQIEDLPQVSVQSLARSTLKLLDGRKVCHYSEVHSLETQRATLCSNRYMLEIVSEHNHM